jgi:MHS family proline/betaine transporter-like MFS transporter
MVACVVGAIALITVPETTRCPMNGRATPGTPEAPPQMDYDLQPARA